MDTQSNFHHPRNADDAGGANWAKLALTRLGAVAMAGALFWGPSRASSIEVPALQQPLSQIAVPPKPREDYERLGIHRKGFLIFPSLELSEAYEDNLLRSESETVDEFVTFIRPDVRAESQWSSHAMNFRAGGDASRYAKNSDQNTTDYFFSADGRFDRSSRSSLSASISVSRMHLQRGDPNTPTFLSKPTEFFLSRADIGGNHRFNRIAINLNGRISRYRYDNGTNRRTGAVIIQNDRDRDHIDLTARVTYDIVSEVDAFTRISVNERDYERLQGRGRFQRDAKGFEITAGTEMEIEDIISGELFAGFYHQAYDDPRLDTTNDLVFGGSLLWNLTRLTSFNAELSRSPKETTNANASTIVSTTVGVLVEHKLLRNVALNANGRYTNDRFVGIDREDHYYNFGLGGNYFINRFSSLRIGYSFSRRRSSNSTNNFDNNIISVTLNLHI